MPPRYSPVHRHRRNKLWRRHAVRSHRTDPVKQLPPLLPPRCDSVGFSIRPQHRLRPLPRHAPYFLRPNGIAASSCKKASKDSVLHYFGMQYRATTQHHLVAPARTGLTELTGRIPHALLDWEVGRRGGGWERRADLLISAPVLSLQQDSVQ